MWTLPKKVHVGNGCARCFLEKTEKKSVKFGLGGRSNISLPRIGGSHPVPSLSLLSTERRGTAMYYFGSTQANLRMHSSLKREHFTLRFALMTRFTTFACSPLRFCQLQACVWQNYTDCASFGKSADSKLLTQFCLPASLPMTFSFCNLGNFSTLIYGGIIIIIIII